MHSGFTSIISFRPVIITVRLVFSFTTFFDPTDYVLYALDVRREQWYERYDYYYTATYFNLGL